MQFKTSTSVKRTHYVIAIVNRRLTISGPLMYRYAFL